MSINSVYFTLQEIKDNVFAAIGRREEGGEVSNMGLVDLGSYALMIDSGFLPASAKDLIAAAAQLMNKPVKMLVNTHYHSDHVQGNYLLPADAVLISTVTTRALIAEKTPESLKKLPNHVAETLEDLEKQLMETPSAERRAIEQKLQFYLTLKDFAPDMRARPPEVTFSTTLSLYGRRGQADLLSHGAGHSPSDAVVYLPDEKVLFAGDLLFNGYHPFIMDGDPKNWQATIERLEDLEIDVVVPGHGPVATKADLVTQKTYLAQLEALVREVIANDGTADDAASVSVPSEYDAYLSAERFSQSMRFLYEFLGEDQ